MTGEEFVRLCYEEKEAMLYEYTAPESESAVAGMVRQLVSAGADRQQLRALIDQVLTESWYTMLLALDGETSLGGTQMCYGLSDEDGHKMNECGELEAAAWDHFMEKTSA